MWIRNYSIYAGKRGAQEERQILARKAFRPPKQEETKKFPY
jgi:hypothetical protein